MPLELPPGLHGNERQVEYRWVLSKLEPNTSVLDVGTVAPPIMSGYPEFVFHVTRRLGCRYVTLDTMPGANILADIREVELPDQSFDQVVCISTLEHITIRPADALKNMVRIGRRVLVTMPFGLDHEMPWGFNYGLDRFEDLITKTGLGVASLVEFFKIAETEFYRHGLQGWESCPFQDLRSTPYWASGSDGASGIVCFEVKHA